MAVLLVVTGCVDPLGPRPVLSENQMVLGTGRVNVSVDTKVPISGTTFPTDRGMVVSAYSNDASSALFTGYEFAYDSDEGGWKSSDSPMWPSAGTTDFLAYSCPGVTPTVTWNSSNPSAGITSFVLPSIDVAQTDLLFGAASGCEYDENNLPVLNFKHALSQIAFIGTSPDATGVGNSSTGVTIESIFLLFVYHGGTCSVTRSGNDIGSITWSSLSDYSRHMISSSTGLSKGETQVGNGLLLPPQTAVGFTITYYLNGVLKSYTYEPTSTSTWNMGVRHIYRIEIPSNGNVSVLESVEDWADVTRTWFYGDAATITQCGSAFTLASNQPVFWRRFDTENYTRLTYLSGTWGSSVKFSCGSDYFVTVTKNGNGTFSLSYEARLVGMRVSPNDIDLRSLSAGLVGWTNASGPVSNSQWLSYDLIYADGSERHYDYYSSMPGDFSESLAQTKQVYYSENRYHQNMGNTICCIAYYCGYISPAFCKIEGAYTESDRSWYAPEWEEDENRDYNSVGAGRYIQPGDSHVFGTISYTENGVTVSDNIRVNLPFIPGTFAGYMIASAPLYYDGSNFVIKDTDWNHDSYNSLYGAVAGSYYFTWNECHNVSGVSHNGYSDWRMPTQDEWTAILSDSRTGSTINGTNNCRIAIVKLSGVSYAGNSAPYGILLAPDGKSFPHMGKTLTWNVVNSFPSGNTIGSSYLNNYLAQGCVFLPASGIWDISSNSWVQGGNSGHYWTSTSYSDTHAVYWLTSSSMSAITNKSKNTYSVCRLIRPAN